MKRFASCISIFAFLIGYLSGSGLEAAQLKKVRLAFSALAYANPPFWIAHDLKLFEKYGIESEIIYLDFLADKHPRLKVKNPADCVDARFLHKLEEEGFFKKFSTR